METTKTILQTYIKKHLFHAMANEGLSFYIQQADKDDLLQELATADVKVGNRTISKVEKFTWDSMFNDVNDIDAYSYAAYNNAVKSFAKKYKENKKMKYMELEMLEEVMRSYIEPDYDFENVFWQSKAIEHLTKLERSVLFLKYVKDCSYKDIINTYAAFKEYNISQIRKISERARKKLLDIYALLAHKDVF